MISCMVNLVHVEGMLDLLSFGPKFVVAIPIIDSHLSAAMMLMRRLLLLAFVLTKASVQAVQDVETHELHGTEPGLRMRVTQHALDYLTHQLLPNVLQSLSDVQLTEGASGTYSNINYRMWNVHINKIAVKQPDMIFQVPKGLQLCLRGLGC